MTDTLKRVAATLAAHGQREAAAEVADISLMIRYAASDFSDEELAVMSIFDMSKPSYRADVMKRAGLGAYSTDNPHIQSLIKKHIVKVTGNDAMALDKKKAREAMSKHEVPAKYKSHLDNFNMQFKTASTPKQAEGDDGQEFADLLKKGGMQVKYNAKTDSGTASGSGISLDFSPSTNDGGVWVEVTMRKFKAASGEAADAVLDMVKAVRKVY